ncbi:Uncharacterized protein OBRU01_14503, partial [Operophtera brumata]
MANKYDPNAVWVALSEQSHETNIFDVYSKLLAQLLVQEDAARQGGDHSEAEKLVLPSDKEWRMQLYFNLVSMQRNLTSQVSHSEEEDRANVKPVEEPLDEWAPWNLVVPTKNPHAPPPVSIKIAPGPVWDIEQVLKAARLLCKPPLHVEFTDEHEMRCVYSLIYDIKPFWTKRLKIWTFSAITRKLSDLLPQHLREERISACVNKDTVTGWVNTFKAKKVALLVQRLHELGYSYSNSRQLCAGEPSVNQGIGQMELVKDGIIVLQLRELSAVLKAKAPAAPATPELGRLVVFGAGDKEEVYCDTPAVATALDGVVAALAMPPNSYSAVTDPIDLVCGRGGDIAMLEILTQSNIDAEGKARVQSILEEQKKTLRTLMSKPQIQLILYETHSSLEAENQAQITRAIAEANRLARERHALLKKKHRMQSPHKHAMAEPTTLEKTISRSDLDKDDYTEDSGSYPSPKRPHSASLSNDNRSMPQSEDVGRSKPTPRPGTDKARPIPVMPHPDTETIPKDPDQDNPHIYEINRLDAKFMIRVAEERGLFGGGGVQQAQARRKRPDHAPADNKRRLRKASFE